MFGGLGDEAVMGMGLTGRPRGGDVGPSATALILTSGLPAGFSLARADSVRTYRQSNGKYAVAAANQPRLHHDSFGAPLGLAFERAAADKCLLGVNPGTAPTDTTGSFFSTPTGVSRVNSGLSLAGIGWEDLITAVLRITNATASTLNHQIKQTTLNTNKHSLQLLTRDTSGGGAAVSALQLTGGATVNLSASDSWELLQLENQTPSSASRLLQIVTRANRAQDIAFALMTEAAYAPLPYLRPTDNVAVTLANEYATAPINSLPEFKDGCTIAFEWYHEWPFSVDNEPVFAIHGANPATDYIRIVGMADGTMKADVVIGGVSAGSWTFAAPTRRTVCRAALRIKSGNFNAAINGVAGATSTATASMSGFTTISINRLGTAYSNSLARAIESTSTVLDNNGLIAATSEGFA